MISQRHRFHGYNALRGVYQRGHSVRGPLMSLRTSSRSSSKPYRVAVVVSRKVSKSAVVRNRIRRRVYEAVRQYEQQLAPGTDLVFTAFSDQLAELEPAKLQRLVTDLLRKATTP